MGQVRESFSPRLMGADSSLNLPGMYIGGFLAVTSGALTVTSKAADGLTDVTLVDGIPVTAGAFTPLPIVVPATGYTVTLSGGASGTLLV